MMIDLHSHLLPGIDDGPEDLSTALDMARLAVASGTTHLICTPHIHPGRYSNDAASIKLAWQAFDKALKSAGIPLRTGFAAEVRFGSELFTSIGDGTVPFMGDWNGRKAVLLEFSHADVPFGAERMTEWMLAQGVVPIIAHPERNKGIMRHPARLKAFLQQGCLLQVTAGSVAGKFGERARKLAHSLLREGVVNILASDGHNLGKRPPDMRHGLRVASEIVGERQAKHLVLDTPWKIVHGQLV
ncbi:protein-tyrosine phosphatase [Halopseudomonas xinjiangensis]|uniref:protein-tyrosine-phosphatase n=1 Tax=Halopseudomonas xinjiangensis TaxID=487184 RepID=A0A1H1WDC0_9GAMM|nr:CpsB/CapC family capsule biosynthesis tyrosine phosphatase [Halopseudomonas xinjiangensis]SDS95004.1 protein-tyrosine phosphatase [Halopseudomonas xinjiangensis]